MSRYNSSLWDDFKREFLDKQNMVSQIIIINVAVFLAVNLVIFFLWAFYSQTPEYETLKSTFIHWFAVPASLGTLIFQPWTIVTHLFLHEDFWHILFNMLWLYWFGNILREYLGNHKILPVYILGGFAGAVLYILSYNTLPVFREVMPFSYALGASAGVLAVVVGTATLLPNHAINLIFFGPVKLKYIALISVIIDLISIPKGNAGGHIAHLGGALFGFVFIRQLQRGQDWSVGFNRLMDKIIDALTAILGFFKKDRKPKVVYRQRGKPRKSAKTKPSNQDKIDEILDKISKSGYDSLSSDEKELLFRASKED